MKLSGDTYCCQECLKHKRIEREINGSIYYVEIPYRNREWLYQEYVVKNRFAEDIAKECGINKRSLMEWVSKLNINKQSIKTKDITREILYDLYVIQHKNTSEIGKMYDVCDGTILNLMKKFNIPSFSNSDAYKIYLYEKGELEKARKYASSMENRIRSSCRHRGIDVKNFQGFSTTEQHMARNNYKYKDWKRKVFERDNYTCQCCGRRGGDLNAHHLYNFSEYKNLRYNVDNGITFCKECHLINYTGSFHAIYGEHNNTPEQVYDFIRNYKQKAS